MSKQKRISKDLEIIESIQATEQHDEFDQNGGACFRIAANSSYHWGPTYWFTWCTPKIDCYTVSWC